MPERETDFDSWVHEYDDAHAENVKLSGFPTHYFDEYKIKEIAGFLKDRGLIDKKIAFLNFGCGKGKSEKFIRAHIPNAVIYSIDTSQKSIEFAKTANKAIVDLHFSFFDGRKIPFDVSFDVVFVANVFHHIPRSRQEDVLREIHRVLSASGRLFLFEHNPLNPVTVRTIKACPFDEGVVLLSPTYTNRLLKRVGFSRRAIRFTLFFPKLFSLFIPLEKYLRKLPLGAQYYFIAQK